VRLDPRFEGSATLQSLGRMLTFIDPPDHTRLRKLVSRAFTPMVIDRLRIYIRDLVGSLLDPLEETGTGDLVSDFADHIPVTVICELLGVPHEDHARCYEWSEAISLTVEYVVPDEALNAADEATSAYEAYFRGLIAERRSALGDDLLSGLIAANDNTDRLTEDELVSMAVLLLGAGFETTRNLIGSGLLAMLRNPAELAQLRDDPSLIRGAVEEFLRYEPPVQTAVARFALRDVEVDGVLVPEGTIVGAVIAAANRDPARFLRPRPGRHRSARQPPRSPSPPASTTASAPQWPGWKARSPSIPPSGASPGWPSSMTIRRCATPAPSGRTLAAHSACA